MLRSPYWKRRHQSAILAAALFLVVGAALWGRAQGLHKSALFHFPSPCLRSPRVSVSVTWTHRRRRCSVPDDLAKIGGEKGAGGSSTIRLRILWLRAGEEQHARWAERDRQVQVSTEHPLIGVEHLALNRSILSHQLQVYTSFSMTWWRCRVFTGTWNVGGVAPPDDLSLEDWLDTKTDSYDIYVLGYSTLPNLLIY